MIQLFGRTWPFAYRGISSVAHSLWTALDQCNTSLGQTLARLTELHERDEYAYVETVRWAAGLQPRQVRAQIPYICHLPSALKSNRLTLVWATVARKP
jgi:hypothetical protein